MGPVQNIPFIGSGINEWVFPICLVLMVFLTMFDFYSCCLRCFKSKEVYRPKSYHTNEKIEEGRFIVDKFRKDKHLNAVDASLLGGNQHNWDEVNTSVASDISVGSNDRKVDDIKGMQNNSKKKKIKQNRKVNASLNL